MINSMTPESLAETFLSFKCQNQHQETVPFLDFSILFFGTMKELQIVETEDCERLMCTVLEKASELLR